GMAVCRVGRTHAGRGRRFYERGITRRWTRQHSPMDTTFESRWREKQRSLGLDKPSAEMVACDGWLLPRCAATFLTFDGGAKPIWEWAGSPGHWSAAQRARLDRFRVLGSDGAGNPICVDRDAGMIWLLEHEDDFHTTQFVNSSVHQLRELLLAYM